MTKYIKSIFWGLCSMILAGICFSANTLVAQTCDSTDPTYISKGDAQVCGTKVNSIRQYLGIPYAEAPTPENKMRWQPVDAIPLASGSYQTYGPACPQMGTGLDKGQVVGSEDCLFLNIWAPPNAQDFPVMVFVHGGAFIFGGGSPEGNGNIDLYNGWSLAVENNVIVVTLNYRLGALGFMFYEPPDPSDKNYLNINTPVYGNLGLHDQMAALEWIQQNISAFGGKPENVTFFGESAGAMSVGLQLFSTYQSDTGNLFAQAIMESNPMWAPYRTVEGPNGQDEAQAMLEKLCPNANCKAAPTDWVFTNATSTDIVIAQKGIDATLIENFEWQTALPWAPVLGAKRSATDSKVIFQNHQPYTGFVDSKNKRPFMNGTNRDEGVLFAELVASLLGTFGEDEYALLLEDMFFSNDGAKFVSAEIQQFSPVSASRDNTFPYCGDEKNPQCTPTYPTEEKAVSGFGNLVTDFVFRCGNDYAVKQADMGTNQQYSYVFTNTPVVSMFPADVCNEILPATAVKQYFSSNQQLAVCHGYELPYVFNTFQNFPDDNWLVPKTSILAAQAELLAGQMGRDWANFAKDSSHFTPSVTEKTADGLAIYGNQDPWNNYDDLALYDAANCQFFEKSIAPRNWPMASPQ